MRESARDLEISHMAAGTMDLKGQLKASLDQRIDSVLAKFAEFRAGLSAPEKALFAKVLMEDAGGTVATPAAPKKTGAKPGRKPKAEATAPATTDGTTAAAPTGPAKVSLKSLVLNIISAHPEGLKLAEVTAQVQEAINRGEYHSESKNLTNNVGQAVFHLNKDQSIKKSETDTKKYVVA
jgi:hypothetical protein